MTDGPGPRTVLWMQGCTIHCPGCQNKNLWPFREGKGMPPSVIGEMLLAVADKNDDKQPLTITGGEPFDQLEELAGLLIYLRHMAPFREIILYTGYTWENLADRSKTNKWVLQVLHRINILVDGPYIPEMDDEWMQWRGSSNQRVIDVKQSLLARAIEAQRQVCLLDWDHPQVEIQNGDINGAEGVLKALGYNDSETIPRCGQAQAPTASQLQVERRHTDRVRGRLT